MDKEKLRLLLLDGRKKYEALLEKDCSEARKFWNEMIDFHKAILRKLSE